jgi:hypothetical protein
MANNFARHHPRTPQRDVEPHQYGQFILPFVVLRRLDRVLEPTKQNVIDKAASLSDKVGNVDPILERKGLAASKSVPGDRRVCPVEITTTTAMVTMVTLTKENRFGAPPAAWPAVFPAGSCQSLTALRPSRYGRNP